MTPPRLASLSALTRFCWQKRWYSTSSEWQPSPPKFLSSRAAAVDMLVDSFNFVLVSLVSRLSRAFSSAVVYGAAAKAYVMAGLKHVSTILCFCAVLAYDHRKLCTCFFIFWTVALNWCL